MQIRLTQASELDKIMGIYTAAQEFMCATGNPNQWPKGYPPQSSVEQDIIDGKSHVCIDSDGEIAAVFYYAIEEEPTYAEIFDGQWLNDRPYGIVHRIAVNRAGKGVAGFCLDWCLQKCKNLRIDTHRQNSAMRRCLEKKGFTMCGIVHIQNGDERIAYHRVNAD